MLDLISNEKHSRTLRFHSPLDRDSEPGTKRSVDKAAVHKIAQGGSVPATKRRGQEHARKEKEKEKAAMRRTQRVDALPGRSQQRRPRALEKIDETLLSGTARSQQFNVRKSPPDDEIA